MENSLVADPFVYWLCHRWKWKDWQVIVSIMVVSAIIMLGFGTVASQSYIGLGRRIQSVDNLSFILAWITIFIPLIWGIYLWQVRAVVSVFKQLRAKEIFGKADTACTQKVNAEVEKIIAGLARPWVYLLVFFLLIGFWLYEMQLGWPQQFQSKGLQYWWEVRWYLPLHLFAWTIGLYAIFTLAIRQMIIVYGLSAVLRKFDVHVKVNDPDEVGGLGSIGSFIKTSIMFVIGIGVLAALFAIEVAVAGSNILERFDVLGLFLIYMILAPLCLIIPTIHGRRAMLRARQRALAPIAAQYQATMEEARVQIAKKIPTEEIENFNERLAALQKHQDLILQSFPITPITIRAFRNFSITALLPILSGIVSIMLQLLNF